MAKPSDAQLKDIGIAVLRISAGLLMAISHGWPKLLKLGDDPIRFADPLGLGMTISLVLAVFGEFICALLVAVGFKTRFAAVPVVITMLVAALIVHGSDPWQKKEFALLYALVFLVLAITGSAKFSLEGLLSRRS